MWGGDAFHIDCDDMLGRAFLFTRAALLYQFKCMTTVWSCIVAGLVFSLFDSDGGRNLPDSLALHTQWSRCSTHAVVSLFTRSGVVYAGSGASQWW